MTAYPTHLIQRVVLADGSALTIRPIRPEDSGLVQEFFNSLSDESRYYRFMDTLRELPPRMLSHFTHVDHDSHLALIAVSEMSGKEQEVAVARYVAGAGREACEFAIVVADEWQHKGLGRHLMQALIAAARHSGIGLMYGEVLAANAKMLRFVARLGFTAKLNAADPRLVRVELPLAP